MSIYDNLTNEQINDIVRKAAKEDPSMLTSALRAAGNFVYLIVPEDITEYDDYAHEGDLKITEDEAKETMIEFGSKLADCVDYNTIIEGIVDSLLILRREKEKKNNA